MKTAKKSRLFTLPSDLLFVEEEIGIVLPTLDESQHTAPEVIIEDPEEEEEEDGTTEPVRVFVGMPITVQAHYLDAVSGPDASVSVETDDSDDGLSEDDFSEEVSVETPLFLLPKPPPIAAQLPSQLSPAAASPAADGPSEEPSNPFVILEIVDDDYTDEVAAHAQDEADVIRLPAPKPASRPDPGASRPLALALALAAATVLLVLLGS